MQKNDGYYVVKNIRFSRDLPIYYDLWLLLKDLDNDELDELQKYTAKGNEDNLKLGYAEPWFKYISAASSKTIAAR